MTNTNTVEGAVDHNVAALGRQMGYELLKTAQFEWAPKHGGPVAQGTAVIAALHVLVSAVRGLARMGVSDASAAELWELVKDRGDELIANAEGEIEEIQAPNA